MMDLKASKDSTFVDKSSWFLMLKFKDSSARKILLCILWISLHKKWSFTLRISAVNVTKSAENCGFGPNYWRNPYWETSFFAECIPLHILNIPVTKPCLFLSALRQNCLSSTIFKWISVIKVNNAGTSFV